LRDTSATLASLSADATTPLSQLATVPGRVVLLLGSERRGPSAELDGLAARRFSVPMDESVESLNVSVAGGIALYERFAATSGDPDEVPVAKAQIRDR
jgi:tRNA G18 (ribose-2'-O)-methylase SpoU